MPDYEKFLREAVELLEDSYSYIVRRGLGIEDEIDEFLNRVCPVLDIKRWPRDANGQYDLDADVSKR